MSGEQGEKVMTGKRRSRRRGWWVLFLAVIVVAVVAGNAWIGEWLVVQAMERLAPRWGWRVEAGTVSAGLWKPIVLRNVRAASVVGAKPVKTLEADEVVVAVNSPLEILFGDGRVIRRLDCAGAEWVVDLRGGDPGRRTADPGAGPAERERRAAMRLRFLPETITVRSGAVLVESDYGSLGIEGISGALSEETASELTLGAVSARLGGRSFEGRGLRAVTSWRDGVALLSDVGLSEAVLVRTLVIGFVDPGGPSVSLDLAVAGGEVRGDVSWRREAGLLKVDLALSAAQLPLEAVAELSGLAEPFGGTLREGRVTWRGTPGRWADSEIALRLEAEGLTRRGERWDSLVAGANFIGRRLYLSNFQLNAAENRVTANGEIAVPRGGGGWLDSNFLLNVAVEVREMRKLAVFTGDWWRDLEGQLSLHGSVSGEKGKMDGYASGEASGLTLRGLPKAAMKFSAVLNDRELEVRSAELWSGGDRLTAKGSVDLAAPHHYSGEIAGRMADVSRFTGKLGGSTARWLESGGFTVSWQGDGTWAAHSGVFRATLADAATPWTPAGITGEVEGSYSPENVYLSRLRLRNGPLEFNTRLTLSDAGINLADVELRRSRLELLAGEAFVPVNLFGLLRGERPADAIDQTKPVYARMASGDLPLAELVAMAGQDAAVEGTVTFQLEASGPLPTMSLEGAISGRGLSGAAAGYQFPQAAVDLAISTEASRLLANGSINSRGFEPLVVVAEMPFGFEIVDGGQARFFDRSAPISAEISIPRTNLPVVGALIPGVEATAGTVSGVLGIAGTVADPEFSGKLDLTDAAVALSDLAAPGVTDLDAEIRLAESTIKIASARGKVGGGDAEFVGSWDTERVEPLEVELRVKDAAVEGFGLKGRGDLQLRAVGNLQVGRVGGSIKIAEGTVDRTFSVQTVTGGASKGEGSQKVRATGAVGGWTLATGVELGDGVKIGRGDEAGSLSGKLAVVGPLSESRLAGELAVTDLTVRSKAGWKLPVSGTLFFASRRPGAPGVVLAGRSVVAGRELEYVAVGNLPELSTWVRGGGGVVDPLIGSALNAARAIRFETGVGAAASELPKLPARSGVRIRVRVDEESSE